MADKRKPTAPDRLTMDLFAPGMTAIHRAGLGGLACTLRAMEAEFAEGDVPWAVTDRSVTLLFGQPENAGDYLKRLFGFAFRVRGDGLITLSGQAEVEPAAAVLADLQAGLTLTFLQHGKSRKLSEKPITAMYDPEGSAAPGVIVEYRRCMSFKHQSGWKAFIKKDRLASRPISIEGPVNPGAVVRHWAYKADTAAANPPELMLPLYFALVGCLPLPVNRGVGVLLVPEVENLSDFVLDRPGMTPTTARECQIGNAADAALQLQLRLRSRKRLTGTLVPGCYAMTFTPRPWASKQKIRVATLHVTQGDDLSLDRFERALLHLPTQIKTHTLTEKSAGTRKSKVLTERQEAFRAVSVIRPLVASNLTAERPWYAGFTALMTKVNPATDKPYRNQVGFEWKGLNAMIGDAQMWGDDESSALVIKAVHQAMFQTRGRIRQETDGLGGPLSQATKNRWARFEERLRLDLAGAKTAAQVRFALADLFSRGGNNAVLREEWPKVLPVLQREWQLARDLGLVALVSYSGRSELAEPNSTDPAQP